MRNETREATPASQEETMAEELDPQAALGLWREVLRHGIKGEGPDLSARQMAILLTVYLAPPPHTVRGLAADLAISKPAVTRALDALGLLDFVRRERDPRDGRGVLARRTVKGTLYLSRFAAHIADAAGELGSKETRGEA